MRDAVVEELVAVADESVLAVHVLQVRLRVDVARIVADLGEGGLQQPGGVAVAAGAAFGADPADAKALLPAGVFLHQPQRRDDFAVGAFEPEVAGVRPPIYAGPSPS